MNKRVFIVPTCTDFLYDTKMIIGGMNVQMYMWAQTFIEHGWEVYGLTHLPQHKNVVVEGVHHVFFKRRNHFEALRSFFFYLGALAKIRPSLVLVRGRGFGLYPLTIFAKLFGVKVVFMVAADTNMDKGHEAKVNFATRMFRKAIGHVKYIVAQNTIQQDQIKINYHKESIIIPNIWRKLDYGDDAANEKKEVLWVGNVKQVKRPSWFLDLAERFPEYQFVMAGGHPRAREMYDECRERAERIPNLSFLGRLEFKDADARFRRAKVVVCTSISEGFPNTFLQAWTNGVPVVSTVNPNDIITTYQMGFVGDTVDALAEGLEALMRDDALYSQYSENVSRYFDGAHDADALYTKLINYIEQ